MNLMLTDQRAFWAEYQNEPMPDETPGDYHLDADEICQRLNGLKRGQIHHDTATIVAFIDIQGTSLWFTVCGFASDFTGWLIDYGAFPHQQGRPYYTTDDIRETLATAYPGAALEGQIYGGLRDLVKELAGRTYQTPTGLKAKLELCLIDFNWHESTDVVFDFCQASKYGHLLLPSRGQFIGPRSKPMDKWAAKKGEKAGPGWRLSAPSRRSVRFVTMDVNGWKSKMAERLQTPMGDPGGLTLFGKDPQVHQMFADHCTAETCTVQGEDRGRRVGVWKMMFGRDNHLWDGLVGCGVGASIQGCAIAADAQSEGKHHRGKSIKSALKPTKRRKVSFADLHKKAKQDSGK